MSKVDQVKEYVLKNYKEYKNETIIVSEHETHYFSKKTPRWSSFSIR